MSDQQIRCPWCLLEFRALPPTRREVVENDICAVCPVCGYQIAADQYEPVIDKQQ